MPRLQAAFTLECAAEVLQVTPVSRLLANRQPRNGTKLSMIGFGGRWRGQGIDHATVCLNGTTKASPVAGPPAPIPALSE
jgi:hypothetical protein